MLTSALILKGRFILPDLRNPKNSQKKGIKLQELLRLPIKPMKNTHNFRTPFLCPTLSKRWVTKQKKTKKKPNNNKKNPLLFLCLKAIQGEAVWAEVVSSHIKLISLKWRNPISLQQNPWNKTSLQTEHSDTAFLIPRNIIQSCGSNRGTQNQPPVYPE